MNTAPHLAAGRAAEDQTLGMLRRAGLTLLARNYRCPQGELDLVMRDGDALAVIEVRYRRESGYGKAADTVDARKQAKLLRATQHYLQQNPPLRLLPARFDVVAITEDGDGAPQVEWIKDAFRADF